jgi:hypothetical protein
MQVDMRCVSLKIEEKNFWSTDLYRKGHACLGQFFSDNISLMGIKRSRI